MSVTLSLFAGAGAQFLDNNGLPLSGGQIYTYNAGTTTPLATYTTNLGNVAQSNPIILNASGRIATGELWLTTGYGYKFVVEDSNNVLIGTYDNVPSSTQPPIINDASSVAYEEGTNTLAGSFVIGNSYLITSLGNTNFQLIGASANQVGIHFIATGVGSGTGTAEFSRTVQVKFQETISVLDFGAVGNGTTSDSLAIQNSINAMESLNKPYKLLFPAGHTYLIDTPLRFTLGNVELCGGGTLNIQSSNFSSGILINGFNTDARAGLIFWNGNYVYTNGLSDQTYDSSLQSNIYIHDLSFYDSYTQSTSFTQFSTALMLAWCGNVKIQNCNFSNFAGEIILGTLKNFNISNNYFYNSANQAISLFDYDGIVSNNNCYLLGEFYEGSGNNVVIANNVGDYCGDIRGTTPSKYIISIGGGNVGILTKCIVSNNLFSNVNITNGIQFTDSISNSLINLQIIGNYFQGYINNGAFIGIFTSASDNGFLLISNNICIEDASNPYHFDSCIQIYNSFASSIPPSYYILDNQCIIQSTGKANTVIDAVNVQNGIIKGNVVKLIGTLNSAVVGYAIANSSNTIWISVTGSESAFGYPNLIVKDNIVNNVVCSDDTLRVLATTGTDVLDCLGRSYIEMVNTGALNVQQIKGQIGQTVTIHVTSGTITFKQGALMSTSTGADENVTAGQIYKVCFYAFTAGTSTTLLAKALSAPVTI